MLSSHRILSTATHSGDGVFGKATGTKLIYRVIADCHAKNNQINDEWLIRDLSAIVKQLGWTAEDYARQQIADEGGPNACTKPFNQYSDMTGPYKGSGNDDEWGQAYADNLKTIMSGDLSVIDKCYDRAAIAAYPCHQTAIGQPDIKAFWLGLRASFSSAKFNIHHQIGQNEPMMPPRAAIRWSLLGKHDGAGRFGAPSGADIYVMGISHAELRKGKILREWVLLDELAIWQQVFSKF